MTLTKETKTIREIRKYLFSNANIDTVVYRAKDEMTNSEARTFLYKFSNQDRGCNTEIQENGTMLIW